MNASRWMATLATGALLLASCESDTAKSERAREVPPAARHGLHSEQLRAIMASMGQQVRETWPEQTGRPGSKETPISTQRYEYIAQVAGNLANAAPSIPGAIPEKVLAGPNRQTFLKLVAQLESQGRGLQKEATAHNRFGMDTTLKQLRATCESCHLQFREFTGPGSLRWGS